MKQRLLGAAVLIALAIIFVPMLLTGPGTKRTSETANLQAPPTPDRKFQERTLSLDLPSPDSTSAQPTVATPPAAPDPNRITTVDTANAPPSAQTQAIDEPAASATLSPVTTAPSSPPSSTTPPPPDTDSVPGMAANGNYFVHLGDYGAKKNATDLAATLKKSGYAAFTESSTFGGKPTLRVRVGPFVDRAAAEATRLRISQTNVRAPASVVQNAGDAEAAPPSQKADAPAAASSSPTTNSSTVAAAGWAVQLGAFATIDEANRLRDKARAASFPVYIDKVTREGKPMWRVRIGPQANRGSAEAALARVSDRLKIDGVVVSSP
ncbi:MAG: SPOR domain-containing protein [Dokdonella sp.]